MVTKPKRAVRRWAFKDVLPLLGWNREMPYDVRLLRRMRDCGLNLAGFVPASALDACRRAGIRAFVEDPRVAGWDWATVTAEEARPRVASLVRAVGRNPALYGYYLYDEPTASMFPGLGVVARLVSELAPGRWPYINLFPNYASPEQLGTPTYEEYLERFIAVCRPPVLCYDNYFLMRDRADEHDLYWLNLEQVRAAGLRHGIPFWNIVSSVGSYHYREPSAADLRLQAYSSLAYGARGIAYFTYFAPLHGNYRMGPVDQFNCETPTWYHLQNTNHQIARLAPTLLQLESTAVYHLGRVPKGCRGPDAASAIQESPDGPVAVGEFRRPDGARFALVVNTDLERSLYYVFGLRDGWSVESVISPYTGEPAPPLGHQTWMAPGQGALLRLRVEPGRE